MKMVSPFFCLVGSLVCFFKIFKITILAFTIRIKIKLYLFTEQFKTPPLPNVHFQEDEYTAQLLIDYGA